MYSYLFMPLSIWPRGGNSWWRVTSGTRPEHQVGSTLSPSIIFISIKWTPNWSFPSLSSPPFLLTLPSSTLPPFLACFVSYFLWTFSFLFPIWTFFFSDLFFLIPYMGLLLCWHFLSYSLCGPFSLLIINFLYPMWTWTFSLLTLCREGFIFLPCNN